MIAASWGKREQEKQEAQRAAKVRGAGEEAGSRSEGGSEEADKGKSMDLFLLEMWLRFLHLNRDPWDLDLNKRLGKRIDAVARLRCKRRRA